MSDGDPLSARRVLVCPPPFLLVDVFGDALDELVSTKISAFSASSAPSLALGSAWFYFDKVGESFVTRARVVGGGGEQGAPIGFESGAVAPVSLQSIWRCKLFALPPQRKAVLRLLRRSRRGVEVLRDSL